MKTGLGSRLLDLLCAALAYVVARSVWSENTGIWRNLPLEIATFLAVFVVLALLVRGRRYLRRGREK